MRNVRQPQNNVYGLIKVVGVLIFWVIFFSVPVILLKGVMSVDQAREPDASTSTDPALSNRHPQTDDYPFRTVLLSLSDFISSVYSGQTDANKKTGMAQRQTVATVNKTRPQNSSDITINMSPRGSFLIDGYINNTGVQFIVDTGASAVVIPSAIAKASGLKAGQSSTITTASAAYTAYLTIVPSMSFGNITLQNITAIINPLALNDQVLLGMTALQFVTVHQANRKMVISAQGISSFTDANGAPLFKKSVQQCNDSGSDRIIINARVLACMKGL